MRQGTVLQIHLTVYGKMPVPGLILIELGLNPDHVSQSCLGVYNRPDNRTIPYLVAEK